MHDKAANPHNITAILCHPHPQYGGSMHDGVLQTAADVLLAQGVDCIRFNFRGVGGSAGHYDNGLGETEDLLAVADWLNESQPDQEQWWLGYSFGSSVVWRALQQRTPTRALLIAPPVGMMDFSGDTGGIRIDAIAGDRDDFVDTAGLQALAGVTTHLIAGADHFFSGYHDALAQTIKQILR